MIDPSRHVCRGLPIVCPGPCNPRLKARHHHHHHHHRHHRDRREKYYDTDDSVATAEDASYPPTTEFVLASSSRGPKAAAAAAVLESDDVSTDGGESLCRTSSFSGIALIRVSSVLRASRRPDEKKIDDATILREILSRGPPPETFFAAPPRKIARIAAPTTPAAATTTPSEDVVCRATTWTLGDARSAIAKRLNGLTPRRPSPLVQCLTILTIYAAIHALLAAVAWRTTASHFYVSSQICGILALVMWRTTGTILI